MIPHIALGYLTTADIPIDLKVKSLDLEPTVNQYWETIAQFKSSFNPNGHVSLLFQSVEYLRRKDSKTEGMSGSEKPFLLTQNKKIFVLSYCEESVFPLVWHTFTFAVLPRKSS